MAASVSSTSVATSSAAVWTRAMRTPCSAQSDRNSARPFAAAAVRSVQVAIENWRQGFSLLERPEHAIEETIE